MLFSSYIIGNNNYYLFIFPMPITFIPLLSFFPSCRALAALIIPHTETPSRFSCPFAFLCIVPCKKMPSEVEQNREMAPTCHTSGTIELSVLFSIPFLQIPALLFTVLTVTMH